jgi:hypothetical protein
MTRYAFSVALPPAAMPLILLPRTRCHHRRQRQSLLLLLYFRRFILFGCHCLPPGCPLMIAVAAMPPDYLPLPDAATLPATPPLPPPPYRRFRCHDMPVFADIFSPMIFHFSILLSLSFR